MNEKRLQEIELLVFESPDAVPLSVSMELAKEVRRLRDELEALKARHARCLKSWEDM